MNLIPASISSALLSVSESGPPEVAREYAQFLDARLMIVDDEPINIKVVRKHLQRAGYKNFVSTADSTQAMDLLRREQPDAVLLDIMMPQVNGLEILSWIRQDATFRHTPVLILTASTDASTKLAALESGATDFLAKPVDPHELLPRLRNVLTVKAHQDYLAGYSVKLEREVQKRTAEVEMSRLRVIQCLARAGEYRDDTTGRHVIRVGRCAAIVASELGHSSQQSAMLEMAAQLHDIGKIGIPDAILLKPAKLSLEETLVMRKHCEYGKAIIEPTSASEAELARKYAELGLIANQLVDSPVLRMAADIAISHHERVDGSGYPFGIRGDSIPLEGRITALVDVFDALHSLRPYKPAYETGKCLEIVNAGRGTEFDASVLDAFVSRIKDIDTVYLENAD
jgi:putative two-component system response regulator